MQKFSENRQICNLESKLVLVNVEYYADEAGSSIVNYTVGTDYKLDLESS